jgi:nucleoid DNA-binding protein
MTSVYEIARTCALDDMSKKAAEELSRRLFSMIGMTLNQGESLVFPGIGRFKVVTVAERTQRNPATGGTIVIPAHRKLVFKRTRGEFEIK